MLRDLRVKNFALIDEVEINFTEGLNVLTGETGAGKSIIVGALEMLLGGRASTDVIRSDKSSAYIEAVFAPANIREVNKILSQSGIETEGEIILLTREIKLNGRNISRINGQLATLGMIRRICQYFVDIHGQHKHQSLLNAKLHLQLLDEYITGDIAEIKDKIKEYFTEINDIEADLNNKNIDEKEKSRRLDLLNHQIREIKEAGLKEGEYKDLKEKYNKLNNMEEIYKITGNIYEKINGENYNNISVLDIMGDLISELKTIKQYDSRIQDFFENLENIFYQLQDMAFEIKNYNQTLEYNREELVKIEERIDLINTLKRKYGDNVKEILDYLQELEQEVNELESRDKLIIKLKEKKEKLILKYEKQAQILSKIRKEQAKKLEKNIKNELKDLAMENTLFKIDFAEKNVSEDGTDKVEFLIRTNPGEDLKSLVNIASGGELSRIMLALKTIIAEIDKVDTLIFDEVDKGVGGKTAQKMAEKMVKISKKRQIICITHLPQIASMADNHIFISKKTEKGRTHTIINNLKKNEKKKELARMLGGVKMTDTTLKHAQEMLEMAEKQKNKF